MSKKQDNPRGPEKMTPCSCSKNDVTARLVVVDIDKKCLEFHNAQAFYRAVELLENQGRQFFIVER